MIGHTDNKSERTFLHGFWSGFGAAALAFADQPKTELKPLYRPGGLADDEAAIRGDWLRVGESLKHAMIKYESETRQAG